MIKRSTLAMALAIAAPLAIVNRGGDGRCAGAPQC